jgi:hypothetical protein
VKGVGFFLLKEKFLKFAELIYNTIAQHKKCESGQWLFFCLFLEGVGFAV